MPTRENSKVPPRVIKASGVAIAEISTIGFSRSVGSFIPVRTKKNAKSAAIINGFLKTPIIIASMLGFLSLKTINAITDKAFSNGIANARKTAVVPTLVVPRSEAVIGTPNKIKLLLKIA